MTDNFSGKSFSDPQSSRLKDEQGWSDDQLAFKAERKAEADASGKPKWRLTAERAREDGIKPSTPTDKFWSLKLTFVEHNEANTALTDHQNNLQFNADNSDAIDDGDAKARPVLTAERLEELRDQQLGDRRLKQVKAQLQDFEAASKAEALHTKLGFTFKLLASTIGAQTPTVFFFDSSRGTQVWREWPSRSPANRNAILSKLGHTDVVAELSADGTLSRKFEEQAIQQAEEGSHVQAFNTPSNCVFFENVVFDWETGGTRQFKQEDMRTHRGKVKFDVKAKATDCDETLQLIDHMVGNGPNAAAKKELILAACALSIVGIQTLGTEFKSAFFVWSAQNGFSGRSTLFRILENASGGNFVGFGKLEDALDKDCLVELDGSTGFFVDERQDIAAASAPVMSVIKGLVGGSLTRKLHRKHEKAFDFRGHFVVHQATNNTDFIWGADQALKERVVALITETIPADAQKAFRANADRKRRVQSTEEASAFLVFLRDHFAGMSIGDVAEKVLELRTKFEEDINQLADSSKPITDFMGQFVEPVESLEDGREPLLLSDLLARFNDWQKRNWPNNRPMSVRKLKQELQRDDKWAGRILDHKGSRKLDRAVFDNETFELEKPNTWV